MYQVNYTPDYVHVELISNRWVLSSAVLNGGLIQAKHILNLKVTQNFSGKKTDFEPPDITLSTYGQSLGLQGTVVGMMTSAPMTSFRQVSINEQETEVTALVTVGVSNAKRAGEPAEWRKIGSGIDETGTINIIILTNKILTQAAMVEAVITVTEAKTVALNNLDITSSKTGELATGTGTDAIAIVSGLDSPEIHYCGKHVLFGEMLATATIQAITDSFTNRED